MHLTESEVPESVIGIPNKNNQNGTIINNNSFIITINKGSHTGKNQPSTVDKNGKRLPKLP